MPTVFLSTHGSITETATSRNLQPSCLLGGSSGILIARCAVYCANVRYRERLDVQNIILVVDVYVAVSRLMMRSMIPSGPNMSVRRYRIYRHMGIIWVSYMHQMGVVYVQREGFIGDEISDDTHLRYYVYAMCCDLSYKLPSTHRTRTFMQTGIGFVALLLVEGWGSL